MSLYVQIVNEEVKQCWDTLPPDGVGNNGWRNAVEVRPALIQGRQGYTGHTFDLTKDPVEIVYSTYDFTLDERKDQLKSKAMNAVMQMDNAGRFGETEYTQEEIDAAQATADAKIAEIDAVTTHEGLDALV